MKRIVLLLWCLVAVGQLTAQQGLEPRKSYLVTDVNEKSLTSVLKVCQKGGIEYLLVRSPFLTYGHYRWNPDFARDDKAVARMVREAEDAGVHLGLLIQPDAISENDLFFSAKNSKSFLREGRVELFSDITDDDVDIALLYNGVIKGISSMNLILIEDELISYGTIERAGELLLLHHCTRGVCGTRRSSHSTAAEVYKIWDSPDRFVAPEGCLRDSVRQRLNHRIEASGVAFVLRAGEPGQELIDGSIRVRQVERWAADGDLESLGWINLHAADKKRQATSIDDVEWVLSKAVAFNAGYGVLADPKTMKEHGRMDEILEKIRQWDTIRYAGSLTPEHREAMRDPYSDWHLERDEDGEFELSQRHFSRRYQCRFVEADSLLIGAEPWEWKADSEGRFGLRIQVNGKVTIKDPMVNTEKGLVMFPCVIEPGQCLVYDFDEMACVMDANGHTIKEMAVEGVSLLPSGTSEVRLYCETEKEGAWPEVTVRYVTSSLIGRIGVENYHK